MLNRKTDIPEKTNLLFLLDRRQNESTRFPLVLVLARKAAECSGQGDSMNSTGHLPILIWFCFETRIVMKALCRHHDALHSGFCFDKTSLPIAAPFLSAIMGQYHE